MIITTNTGDTFIDIVTCGKCYGASVDLSLTRCPQDGTVLGERSVTPEQLTHIRPLITADIANLFRNTF